MNTHHTFGDLEDHVYQTPFSSLPILDKNKCHVFLICFHLFGVFLFPCAEVWQDTAILFIKCNVYATTIITSLHSSLWIGFQLALLHI